MTLVDRVNAAVPAGDIAAVEFNVSCHNVNFDFSTILEDVLDEAVPRSNHPVILKLSPGLRLPAQRRSRPPRPACRALTAINTVKALRLDPRTGTPVAGQPLRRAVRAGDQADRAAGGGRAARRRGDAADHRHRRHPHRRRLPRVLLGRRRRGEPGQRDLAGQLPRVRSRSAARRCAFGACCEPFGATRRCRTAAACRRRQRSSPGRGAGAPVGAGTEGSDDDDVRCHRRPAARSRSPAASRADRRVRDHAAGGRAALPVRGRRAARSTSASCSSPAPCATGWPSRSPAACAPSPRWPGPRCARPPGTRSRTRRWTTCWPGSASCRRTRTSSRRCMALARARIPAYAFTHGTAAVACDALDKAGLRTYLRGVLSTERDPLVQATRPGLPLGLPAGGSAAGAGGAGGRALVGRARRCARRADRRAGHPAGGRRAGRGRRARTWRPSGWTPWWTG